jgi:hypothetical protein
MTPQVNLRVPEVSRRMAEIYLLAKPALITCRADAGGSGSAIEGDTFVLRARSGEVQLQSPLWREQPELQRYAGQLLVAEGGRYELELWWLNTGFAGWFDVNEASEVGHGVVLRFAGRGGNASVSSASVSSASVSSASVSGASARPCPQAAPGLFSIKLIDEHLPHFATTFSVRDADAMDGADANEMALVSSSSSESASSSSESASSSSQSSSSSSQSSSSSSEPTVTRSKDSAEHAQGIVPPMAHVTAPPRACSGAALSGRWIGRDFAPFGCYLLHHTLGSVQQCTRQRPLHIALYGDSIMRGLYFDLAELLTGTKLDRGWAKRHAGAGKGKRLSTRHGEHFSVSWAWWTLHDTYHDTHVASGQASGAADDGQPRRTPPPVSLTNWSLDEPNTVVVVGSAAHDMRYRSVHEYEQAMHRLGAQIRARRPFRAQLYWLIGAANHLYDDDLECPAEGSKEAGGTGHRMSFHRSMLFSAVGAEALRGVAPALDMWRVTADQAERCAKTHYDELYVEKDEGLVSRTVANLLLNAACNSRLLPSDELL